MRETLEEKLNSEHPTYTQAEIDWLLENIGHEKPEIRDDLVFVTLARSIHLGFFGKAQFQYLAEQSQARDLQFYQLENGLPAVLTRTFAALLNSNLIWADGASESPYFQALTPSQRDYFFECGLIYLTKEQFSRATLSSTAGFMALRTGRTCWSALCSTQISRKIKLCKL